MLYLFDQVPILTKNNHTRSSISDFLILRPGQLDHRLGSWVSNIDFPQDGMTIVRKPVNAFHQPISPVFGAKRVVTEAYNIPPIGSRIIFSIALGPKHVRMTSATVYPYNFL